MDELDNLMAASFIEESNVTKNVEDITKNNSKTDETDDNEKPIKGDVEGKEKVVIEEETITENIEEVGGTKDYIKVLEKHGLLFLPEGTDLEKETEESVWTKAQEHTRTMYQNAAIESLLDAIPDKLRDAVLYTVKGGEDYMSFFQEKDSFDITTESGQVAAIRSYYKNVNNWNDDRIERAVKRLDTEDLKEEAEIALSAIEEHEAELAQEKIKAQQDAQKAEEQAMIHYQQTLRTAIADAKFIEDGRKKNIQNFMFNPVKKQDGMSTEYQRVLKQIQGSPQHMAQLADLLLDYDKEKGIPYDRFKRSAKTSLTQDLQKALSTTDKQKSAAIKDEDINWASLLSNMK
jgi:hypothetical protein